MRKTLGRMCLASMAVSIVVLGTGVLGTVKADGDYVNCCCQGKGAGCDYLCNRYLTGCFPEGSVESIKSLGGVKPADLGCTPDFPNCCESACVPRQ